MKIMKKTHNKSFMIRAEIGSPLEKKIMNAYPVCPISGVDTPIVILQCQAIVGEKFYLLAEVVRKDDFFGIK